MNNEVLIDYASKKTRFFNLILDSIIFRVLFILHVLLFDDWTKSINREQSAVNYIIYLLVLFFLYNFIFELLFGQTLGKFITGTKVVDYDQKKPTFQALLIRNLCRLIPFDALSFLISENGWHDSISKTTVINK